MSRDVVIDVAGSSTVERSIPEPPRFVEPAAPAPIAPEEADHADELDGEAPAARPKFRLPNLAPVLGLFARVVGSLRRRRAVGDEVADGEGFNPPATADALSAGSDHQVGLDGDPEAAEASARPGLAGRLSPALWSWETRVGVAALFSFLVLVGVLATRRGWFGSSGSATVLALKSPTKGEDPPSAGSTPDPNGVGEPAEAGSKTTPPAPGEVEPAEPAKSPAGGQATPNEGGPSMPTGPEPDPPPSPKAPTGAEPSLGAGLGMPDIDRSAAPAPQSPPNPGGDGLPSLPAMGAADLAENPARPPEMPNPSGGEAPALPGDPAPAAGTPGNVASAPPLPAVAAPAVVPGPALAVPAVVPDPAVAEPGVAGAQGALVEGAVDSALPSFPSLAPPPSGPANVPQKNQAATTSAANPTTISPVAETMPPGVDPSLAPTEAPASTAAIRPADRPPSFESVPIGGTSGAPTPSGSGAAADGWITIPIAGRSRPIQSTPADADPGDRTASSRPGSSDDPGEVINARTTRLADPIPADDRLADQIEPVYHKVRSGENFWTISKLFYRSPRYYRALHAANARQVPDIADLYVGTVLRIPPPEALDRSLIDPASRDGTLDGSAISRTSASSPDDPAPAASPTGPGRATNDDLPSERMVRPGLRGANRKAGSATRSDDSGEADDDADRPRRRSYKVKPYETLRSIARDTLGDPRRADEIYDLNRKVLSSARAPLESGMTLVLPADAVVGPK